MRKYIKDESLRDWAEEYTLSLESTSEQLERISRYIKRSASNDELIAMLEEADDNLKFDVLPFVQDEIRRLENILNQLHKSVF